jgi:hypothetical protein
MDERCLCRYQGEASLSFSKHAMHYQSRQEPQYRCTEYLESLGSVREDSVRQNLSPTLTDRQLVFSNLRSHRAFRVDAAWVASSREVAPPEAPHTLLPIDSASSAYRKSHPSFLLYCALCLLCGCISIGQTGLVCWFSNCCLPHPSMVRAID